MRYYGQLIDGIPVDRLLHQKYFATKQNGFFIECGAADGFNLSSCKFFEETMGWKGINVGASPDKYEKLLINRPNSFLNINVGLLHESGKYVFRDDTVSDPTRFPGWGNGSFQHTERHYTDLIRMGIKLKESEIQTITYKDLIEQTGVTQVDLFILDVEGMELLVIEGMKGCTVFPNYVFVEHEHVGLKETEERLKEFGYRLDYHDFCNSMYIKN